MPPKKKVIESDDDESDDFFADNLSDDDNDSEEPKPKSKGGSKASSTKSVAKPVSRPARSAAQKPATKVIESASEEESEDEADEEDGEEEESKDEDGDFEGEEGEDEEGEDEEEEEEDADDDDDYEMESSKKSPKSATKAKRGKSNDDEDDEDDGSEKRKTKPKSAPKSAPVTKSKSTAKEVSEDATKDQDEEAPPSEAKATATTTKKNARKRVSTDSIGSGVDSLNESGDGPAPSKPPAKKSKSKEELSRETKIANLLSQSTFTTGLLTESKKQPATSLGVVQNFASDTYKDINRKGTTRKIRHLFSMPCRLAFLAQGTLGSLGDLDTRNPVMYWDFPDKGRMKFYGTHIVPNNTYVTLSASKGHINCEDTFQTITVFPKFAWIGKKEENPDEHPLAFPDWLANGTLDKKVNFDAGIGSMSKATAQKDSGDAGAEEDDADDRDTAGEKGLKDISPAKPQKGRAKATAPKATTATKKGSSKNGDIRGFLKKPKTADEDDESGEEDFAPVTKGVAASRSRRQVKPTSYKMEDESDGEDDDEQDEDEFEPDD
eukprot:TRINITY_DN3417_c0_g1_i2.p1 TRINITY_DN3417_c0_g1~~TRINITY_DN3417_c0_g1_i2.p1  ORF type:complete len:550 (+),score=154.89 TRINITY_DN3417_c0_g1_i2:86-1735(+)